MLRSDIVQFELALAPSGVRAFLFGGNMSDKEKLEYYEALLDYLDDMVPCLDDLIAMFDERYDNE